MKRRVLSSLFAVGVAAYGLSGGGAAAAPDVVASIKPIHSLVAGVMEGVAPPHLVVQGGGSPHTFSLRPSDAQALAGAKLVVWVGPELETFLTGPLEKLAPQARLVTLLRAPGVWLLAGREGGVWAEHAHDDGHGHADDDHDHDHHDDDDHDHDHDHGGEEQSGSAAGRADEPVDSHIWLDPANAKAMTAAIAAALAETDPENAATYAANAGAMAARLDALAAELGRALAPVRDRPFVLFHDAFQYLEARYGLNAVGSVTISPDRQPGAERLAALRRTIQDRNAACIFAEPQFEPRLLQVVAEDSNARAAVLDPLGADLADGPELYFSLMRRNARALAECLSAPR